MLRDLSQIFRGLSDGKFVNEYKDPRWLSLSATAIKAHPWCNSCRQHGKKLAAHHTNYVPGRHLWDYDATELVVLCEDCHKVIHEAIKLFRKVAAYGNAGNMAKLALLIQAQIEQNGEVPTLERLAR